MIGIIQGSKAVQMTSETFKSRLGRKWTFNMRRCEMGKGADGFIAS